MNVHIRFQQMELIFVINKLSKYECTKFLNITLSFILNDSLNALTRLYLHGIRRGWDRENMIGIIK